MSNLKDLIVFFIKNFPQNLGRTQLIKAIYLLDCEWYKIHGRTYSGLMYKRDQNGPFDTAFYEAKDELIHQEIIIENRYQHPGGYGYHYFLVPDVTPDLDIHPVAQGIGYEIVETLENKDLQQFLNIAYDTEPMRVVQEKEVSYGGFLYGEELPMSKMKRNLDPLFTLDEVKEELKKMDLEDRGSDEEYNEVVFDEFRQLSKTRERVSDVWEKIGEK